MLADGLLPRSVPTLRPLTFCPGDRLLLIFILINKTFLLLVTTIYNEVRMDYTNKSTSIMTKSVFLFCHFSFRTFFYCFTRVPDQIFRVLLIPYINYRLTFWLKIHTKEVFFLSSFYTERLTLQIISLQMLTSYK